MKKGTIAIIVVAIAAIIMIIIAATKKPEPPEPPGPPEPPEPPPEGEGIIQGYVVNYNTGGRISNAKLSVDGKYTLYSQSDGFYRTSNLTYGTHIITVEADNYRTVNFSVILSQAIKNVNLKLVPTGKGGAILEFSVEPRQIYQQEEIVVHAKVQNTSSVGELFYARVYINSQWSGSIISKWLNPGETYEKSPSITLYNAGTFTVTCKLTGYEKEDVRDQTSVQVTVLPRVIPNMLTLEPEPIHLYDYRFPGRWPDLDFPAAANPQLLSIPKAHFKGEEFAMDIRYSLLPNLISDKHKERTGWYWELWIFNEGDDYNFPFHFPGAGGGPRPSWRLYFSNQTLTSASISRWEPYEEVDAGLVLVYPEPPADLYPESEGWFFRRGSMGGLPSWIAYRRLKDVPGRYPVVVAVWYKSGSIGDYSRYCRAWKVGEIVVPTRQIGTKATIPPGYLTTWEEP